MIKSERSILTRARDTVVWIKRVGGGGGAVRFALGPMGHTALALASNSDWLIGNMP